MVIRVLAILFVFISRVWAEPRHFRFEQTPDKEITCKIIDCRQNGAVKGVLVLVPGCNGDGRTFLDDKGWVRFAEKNRLALVGVTFSSPLKILKARRGYYEASRGSGRVLLSLLEEAGFAGAPLFMFGFSGGAHFVSSFVEEYPERVLAWCAHSAAWWGAICREAADVPLVGKPVCPRVQQNTHHGNTHEGGVSKHGGKSQNALLSIGRVSVKEEGGRRKNGVGYEGQQQHPKTVQEDRAVIGAQIS